MKQVLPLFVCAILVGWFMPTMTADNSLPSETRQSGPAQPAANAFDSGAANDAEQLLPDQIVLERAPDGHFYADIDVNLGTIHFLVDTGATAVALTGDDARAIGLHWSDDELRPIARGVNGAVMGKEIIIDRMQVGNVQATNVRAAIIPEGLEISLLGQTFLARIGSVNIRENQMVWN
ncbi:MAG: TIGR02281 family clan AA aspartic protease [Sphingorhabdus sp.]